MLVDLPLKSAFILEELTQPTVYLDSDIKLGGSKDKKEMCFHRKVGSEENGGEKNQKTEPQKHCVIFINYFLNLENFKYVYITFL